MTTELANEVYQCLVTNAGAREDDRDAFVYNMTSANPTSEWRFQGKLGFGGKYRTMRNKVDYYPENATTEREAIMYNTNAVLKDIFVQHGKN